jgi:hypothetical protein
MRNRALHDALRDFALEAASFLTEDLRGGAELEFEVLDEGGRGGPALYRYRPRTGEFIEDRWPGLRELPTCALAARELGTGASTWLRVSGMPGERAEPALQAMLERLYEDATSFAFPEERFERVYGEVEWTLYRDAIRTQIVVPLRGVVMEPERVDLGHGLALLRDDVVELPPDAFSDDEPPGALMLLEHDVLPEDPLELAEASDRLARLVTAMRLFRSGAVSLASVGWRRADEGRWSPVALAGSGAARGGPWILADGEERELRDFVVAIDAAAPAGTAAWALARFELGCGHELDSLALSDYLLALRALLDATSDAGEASLALRLAALCAEDGDRRRLQHRVELALSLERFLMGAGGPLDSRLEPGESPVELVAELEGHVRALLRDLLLGYLEPDLKGVADDILLETREPYETAEAEAVEYEARDLREEPEEPEIPEELELEPEPELEPELELRQDEGAETERAYVWQPPYDPEPEPASEPDYDYDYDPEPEWDPAAEADTSEFELVVEDGPIEPAPVVPDTVESPAIRITRTSRFEPESEEPEPEFEEFAEPEHERPHQHVLEGVTPSDDWGWGEPEDYSAPV